MLTGDNAQCAHYIARQCSMVSEGAEVLLGDVTPAGGVAWTPLLQTKLSTSLTTAQVRVHPVLHLLLGCVAPLSCLT